MRTARLTLRWLSADDADFVLALVNDPAWLRYIGDRGIHSVEDALAYIENGPRAMYQRLGYGLFAITLSRGAQPIGMCGLIQRDTLPGVDIGYALLPQYRHQGFALEAAQACVTLAREKFGLRRLLAIASPDNEPSARLLGKLGLHFEQLLELVPGSDAVALYAGDI
ncbi:MAG: GNAT family N-acetyltransferase [Pseudomarimonas sp.]